MPNPPRKLAKHTAWLKGKRSRKKKQEASPPAPTASLPLLEDTMCEEEDGGLDAAAGSTAFDCESCRKERRAAMTGMLAEQKFDRIYILKYF